MTGLALAAGAALLWSVADVARKGLVARVPVLALLLCLVVLPLPGFALWAVVGAGPSPSVAYVVPGLCSVVTNLALSLALLQGLKRAPLGVVIPLLSTSPVFSALLEAVWLGGVPQPLQVLGLGIIVFGALLLALDLRRLALSGPAVLRGAGLGLLASALMAAATVFDKVAIRHVEVALHASFQAVVLGSVLSVLLVARGELRDLRAAAANWKFVLLAALAMMAALGLQLLALQSLLAGVVEGLKRGVGLTLSVVCGRAFFGEELSVPRLAAVVVLTTGVAVLAAA